MNLIGTALERKSDNKFYVQFKKQNPNSEDENYEWKCYMLKKYFHDNVVVNLIRLFIGIILLVLCGTSSIYKILGTNKLSTVIVLICLVLGVICTGAGILFSFTNYRCLKNYKDYLWDDEGEIVEKIIKFYDKAH